ncbi:MAG TPA: hypothetical protein VGB85_23335 [Nannocystis sp.]
MTDSATPRPRPPGLREARLQAAISVLATGMLGLGLYLGNALTQAPTTRQCTAETEDVDCDEGELCISGRCRAPRASGPLPCQEGDPCADCMCGEGYQCDAEQRCMPVKEDLCAPEVATLIRDIRRFEQDRCQAVGTDATQCDPKELDRFVIEHDKLNDLLLQLQHTLTVHFDQNEPSAERGLPRPAQRYYGERFARLGDRLRSAKQILILGRSSRDRSSSISRVIANNNLAQNRMQHVAQWIVDLAATPRDRDAMAKKLIRLSLGDRQPLTREQLAKNPMHQYIAWKKGREDLLVSQVRGAEALDDSQREQVSRTLNQSVLVIPVPCEIPE